VLEYWEIAGAFFFYPILQYSITTFNLMPSFLFWFFAIVMLVFGAAVVINRNPIASALSLVVCFLGLSALFMSLDAFFIGIIQVLVYAGAVMVLFLFIIMLLDGLLSEVAFWSRSRFSCKSLLSLVAPEWPNKLFRRSPPGKQTMSAASGWYCLETTTCLSR